MDPTASLEIAQTAGLDMNDIQNTLSMTQELADLNAT